MRVLVALVVALIVAWQIQPWLYDKMETRIDRSVIDKLSHSPVHTSYITVVHSAPDLFLLKLKLSFYIALVLVLPIIILNIWGFVAPALKPSEQKPFKRLAPASALLFIVGASFAYAVVPAMFAWFASYAEDFPGINIQQEAGTQLFLVAKMMLAFGVAFQLPLIVYGLGVAGILTAEALLKYWRHGATAIFFISAVITPSNDPFSMLMMAVPLTGLFIGSVYAVKFMEKKRDKANAIKEPPMAVLDRVEPIVEQNGVDPLERFPLEPQDGTDEQNRTSG